MTADEREAEIAWQAKQLARHLEEARRCRFMAQQALDRLRELVEERTPAEVEQMERERGLR